MKREKSSFLFSAIGLSMFIPVLLGYDQKFPKCYNKISTFCHRESRRYFQMFEYLGYWENEK